MGQFDGKVAVVTGAAHGIGRAACLLFAEHGARVLAADIDATAGAETVELVRAAGGDARFAATDVSKPIDVERMVDSAIREFGRLDFAHNNAGILSSGLPVPDYPIEAWNRGIGVMLSGVFLGMKYELPRILEVGGGAIVNTASGAGLVGFPGMCAYVAAKHGVVGLTKSAALEFAAQNVRINAICPGTARTNMVSEFLGGDSEKEAQLQAMHPIGRIADPKEIAQLVIWLCSDAASFMCGAAVAIDGGYTIQ